MVYDEVEEAIRIANDTVYGLAAYVMGDPRQARDVVRKLRAGSVFVNAANLDPNVPVRRLQAVRQRPRVRENTGSRSSPS
jgi:acyl-CoA reductase-like NAD-dependent aldehyde dehydrogenase